MSSLNFIVSNIFFTKAFKQCDKQAAEHKNQSAGTSVHQQKIAHFQIGVVTQQGSKLSKSRQRRGDGQDKSQKQGENIGCKEIPVMHVRQDKRNTNGKNGGKDHKGGVAESFAHEKSRKQYQKHEGKGTEYGNFCCPLSVLNIGYDGKNGRGVVVEPVSYAAGLTGVKGKGFNKGSAGNYSRHYQYHIAEGKNKKMPQLVFALKPEHCADRQDKHSLQLKAKGQGHHYHRLNRSVLQSKSYTQYSESHIDSVTLGPDRGIEKHRGQIQNRKETGDTAGNGAGKAAQHADTAPGQKQVKENTEQFYKVKVLYAAVGKQSHEIQIGDIIVANGAVKCFEPSVIPVKLHPACKKILIVQSLIVHEAGTQSHGTQKQKNTACGIEGLLHKALTVKKIYAQRSQGAEYEIYAIVHGNLRGRSDSED